MNFLIGTLYAEAIFRLCEEARVKINQIDLVGSHGQTIFHQSEPDVFCGRTLASTLQIGEASIIAEQTGITTICDFRPRDMAAGGKGAPLIPYVDYLLFRHPRHGRILLNIGGIANVTILPAAATLAEIVAFDTGPGNMVIDGLVRRMTHNEMGFDRDGEIARSGKVIPALLKKLVRHPYFSLPPPKTAGREQFGMAFLEKLLQIGRYFLFRGLDLHGNGAHRTDYCEGHRSFYRSKILNSPADCIRRRFQKFLPDAEAQERLIPAGGVAIR